MTGDISLEEIEKIFGKKSTIEERINKIREEIASFKKEGGILITRFNTILAIKMFNRVSHVVDPKVDGNLVPIEFLNSNLNVPRYENNLAQKWFNEDTEFQGKDNENLDNVTIEKVLLSEPQLKEIVLENKKMHLKTMEDSLLLFDRK